jgi:hypothetical protein
MKKPKSLISDLLVCDGSEPCSIPKWAQFYALFGFQLASLDRRNFSRLIIPMLIPSSQYAALFIAMGVVLRRVLDVAIDEETILKKYSTLEKGYPLIHRNKKSWRKGKFIGVSTRMGITYIDVQLEKGKKGVSGPRIQSVPLSRANSAIELAKRDFNLPGVQKAKKRRRSNELTTILNDYGFPTENLYAGKRLDCLIIGNKARLIRETESMKLILVNPGNQENSEGKISDITRPKEKMHFHESFRTFIVPSSKGNKEQLSNLAPYITIFDGANSYLNWSDSAPGSIRLLLLDRTENQLLPAVDRIRFEYSQRRELEISLELPDILPGVEYTYYEI